MNGKSALTNHNLNPDLESRDWGLNHDNLGITDRVPDYMSSIVPLSMIYLSSVYKPNLCLTSFTVTLNSGNLTDENWPEGWSGRGRVVGIESGRWAPRIRIFTLTPNTSGIKKISEPTERLRLASSSRTKRLSSRVVIGYWFLLGNFARSSSLHSKDLHFYNVVNKKS